MEEDKVTVVDDYNKFTCPHCKHNNDFWEQLSTIVTFWSEEGAQEFDCHNCNKQFFILENVSRTWEVAKKEDDFD